MNKQTSSTLRLVCASTSVVAICTFFHRRLSGSVEVPPCSRRVLAERRRCEQSAVARAQAFAAHCCASRGPLIASHLPPTSSCHFEALYVNRGEVRKRHCILSSDAHNELKPSCKRALAGGAGTLLAGSRSSPLVIPRTTSSSIQY